MGELDVDVLEREGIVGEFFETDYDVTATSISLQFLKVTEINSLRKNVNPALIFH
jgi:hypothetical protein